MEIPLPDTKRPEAPALNGRAVEPTIVIEPTSGWQLVDWKELVAYRDLFWLLAMRSVTVRYKQTVLGFAWAFIKPFFSMIVFSVIFGSLAGVPTDGVPKPVFYLAGLLPWQFFSSSMSASTASLTSNKGLLTKVYFPRLIIPTTPVLSNLVDFGIAFLLLGVTMAIYGVAPTGGVLVLPLLIVILMATSIGVGLWLSALSVQYRDVAQAMGFATQLLMYAAPVVWPISLLTEKFPVWGETIRLVYGLYPIAGVIEGFRAALTGATPMPWDLIGLGTLGATVLLVTGAFYFRRMEKRFADVA